MTVGVFAYNFPHKKTQEGLYRLFTEGVEIDCILAANKVKLNVEHSEIRVAQKGLIYQEPSLIAERMGIPFHIVHHNTEEAVDIVKSYNLDVGIILGARILKKPIIDAFNIGIINMHPGKLPDNRGLDNLKWAVLNGMEQGVTAHIISTAIDRGLKLNYNKIDVFPDDSLVDIHIRLQNMELECMVDALNRIAEPDFDKSKLAALPKGTYYKAVPPHVEVDLMDKFEQYKRTYGR